MKVYGVLFLLILLAFSLGLVSGMAYTPSVKYYLIWGLSAGASFVGLVFIAMREVLNELD
jgi:Ca2+/Na+ antiporter